MKETVLTIVPADLCIHILKGNAHFYKSQTLEDKSLKVECVGSHNNKNWWRKAPEAKVWDEEHTSCFILSFQHGWNFTKWRRKGFYYTWSASKSALSVVLLYQYMLQYKIVSKIFAVIPLINRNSLLSFSPFPLS